MMDEVKCNGCNKETDKCHCQELVCAFNNTNRYLYEMDLLDRLAGFTLTNLIQERIDTHVQDTCKGILEMSHINRLLQVHYNENSLFIPSKLICKNLICFSGLILLC